MGKQQKLDIYISIESSMWAASIAKNALGLSLKLIEIWALQVGVLTPKGQLKGRRYRVQPFSLESFKTPSE